MASSGMLSRVALVRTDVSEELGVPNIRVTRIGKLGMAFSFRRSVLQLLVPANDVPSSQILVTLMTDGLSSSEMSVRTRAARRNISEDGILHSHCRENLKSYIALTGWVL
jgi:hypothetical protein